MRALWALVAAFALLPAARADAVEPQTEPGAHDPTLLIQGQRWFVFTTGRGLQRLASADAGRTWQGLAPVFTAPPAWWLEAVPEHKGLDVWAPKLFEHRGRTWLLYSISTFGKNRSAIGLVSSDRPDGDEWRDEGLVVQSRAEDDFNAIDPDLFADTDGRLWLSYGSFWGGIRLTELSADTLKPIGESSFIARRKGGIEAPTLVRHGDWVYLFASYESPTPVFTTDDSVGQFGPGHNSFTTTPDGRTDLLVYHARNYRDIVGDPLNDPHRHTRVQAFGWDADGFPDFGTPVADGPYQIPSL